MNRLTVQLQQEQDFQLILVEGDLDASSALQLDHILQGLLDEGHKRLLIDCSGLQYISSAGVGVFTSRLMILEQGQIGLAFFGMRENVRTVFAILGLDQFLHIATTKEEAKALLNGIQNNYPV